MMNRQLFEVDTDTGTWGDTGPPVFGELVQVHWNPTTADTGADLKLAWLPKAGDTGDGFEFFNDNDCLGTNFQRVPVQANHHSDGFDTGAAQESPVAFAGERLRVKVIPGGAALVGRLYVTFKS